MDTDSITLTFKPNPSIFMIPVASLPCSSIPCCLLESQKAPFIKSTSFLCCLRGLTLILWAAGWALGHGQVVTLFNTMYTRPAHTPAWRRGCFVPHIQPFHKVQTGIEAHSHSCRKLPTNHIRNPLHIRTFWTEFQPMRRNLSIEPSPITTATSGQRGFKETKRKD